MSLREEVGEILRDLAEWSVKTAGVSNGQLSQAEEAILTTISKHKPEKKGHKQNTSYEAGWDDYHDEVNKLLTTKATEANGVGGEEK